MAQQFESLQAEYEYRNKKFLPANIIAIILSIVALISLLFMPVISMDLGQIIGTSLSAMGGGESGEGGEDSSNSEEKLMSKIMEDVLGDLEFKFEINFFDSLDFINGKFNFSDIMSGEDGGLASAMYKEDGLMENMLLYMAAMGSLTHAVNFDMLTDSDFEKVDLGNAVAAIRAAEQNETTAKESYVKAITDVATALGTTVSADQSEKISSDFDSILADGKPEGGNFTVEYLVCSTATEGKYTTYEGMQTYMDEQMSGGSSGEGESAETMEGMDGIFKYIGMAIAGITGIGILCWVLLLLFSLLGIFKKDKRFKIWYVVVFGALPFLCFFVLFKLMGSVVANMAGDMAAGIFGGITSMTWIVGVCWGVLILASIFYMLPRKRKIKKLKKAIKLQETTAAQAPAEN